MGLCDEGKEFLEITTAGSCDMYCTKYCPHEVYRGAYEKPDDLMTLETFQKILDNTPQRVIINFAGFAEPFINPQTKNFIRFAYNHGYKVALSTTLSGVEDISPILDIPFEELALHLPDCFGIAKIKESPNYGQFVIQLLKSQKHVTFSVMNSEFMSNDREKLCRGIHGPQKRFFRTCEKIHVPNYVVMPNGDMYYCCQDFGLTHKIGNLAKEYYYDVWKRATRPKQLCQYCKLYRLWPVWYGRQMWLRKRW